MIFKRSYIATENSGFLRREPLVGPRQIAVLITATVASVMLGVGAFYLVTNMRSVDNRVSWVLQPPKIVKTTARSVKPAKLQAEERLDRGS